MNMILKINKLLKFLLLVLVVLLFSCGTSQNSKTIKIACSSNMLIAMDSISKLYTDTYGIECEITSGSSGLLTSQIQNGAPYDVFFSANMDYPNKIYENGFGQKPITYANGTLILAFKKNLSSNSIIEIINKKKVTRIGIADYELAPYGVAAKQYLENTKQLKGIKHKLVIGESIGQVNLYLSTKSVDVGFTSYSFMLKNGADFNYLKIPFKYYSPIKQGAIILNSNGKENAKQSEEFINFFFSKKCKPVLKYFGYLTD